MDEEAVLVCSPRIVPADKTACGEWLAAQKLIHDDTPYPGASFPSWAEVLEAAQAPTARDSGLHINSTSAVIPPRSAGAASLLFAGRWYNSSSPPASSFSYTRPAAGRSPGPTIL